MRDAGKNQREKDNKLEYVAISKQCNVVESGRERGPSSAEDNTHISYTRPKRPHKSHEKESPRGGLIIMGGGRQTYTQTNTHTQTNNTKKRAWK